MATIKAGTYRFNNVLTFPTRKITERIQFTNDTAIANDVSSPLVRLDVIVYTDGFNDSSDITDISVRYEDDYSLAVGVYISTEGGWIDEGYQTITIPTDSEVSNEFAEWFNANAVLVENNLAIAGCWQFNEEINWPEGEYHIEYEVNFKQSKTFQQCNYIWIDKVEGDISYTTIGARLVDTNNYVGLYDGGWLGEMERYRLIDFGVTPQPISQELYDFITSNAQQVVWKDYITTIQGYWTWNESVDELPINEQYNWANVQIGETIYPWVTFGNAEDFPVGTVCLAMGEGYSSWPIDDNIKAYYIQNSNSPWILPLSTSYLMQNYYEDLINGTAWFDSTDAYRTWFFEKQEIPKVVYNYMLDNAIESKPYVNGIWQLNETVTAIPYEEYELNDANREDREWAITNLGVDCEPTEYISENSVGNTVRVIVKRITPLLTWGDTFENGVPTTFSEYLVAIATIYINDELLQEEEVAPLSLQPGGAINLGSKLQTVTYDVYNWLNTNATQLAQEVSGRWLFNKTLILPHEGFKEIVNYDNLVFGSLLLKCHTMGVYSNYLEYYVQEHIPLMSYDGDSHTAYSTSEGWYRVGHEIVDFGEIPQEVSGKFYNWLNANARPMTQISGCYKWNDTITPPEADISERVTYQAGIANGRLCRDIYISGQNMVYRTKETDDLLVLDNSIWQNWESEAAHTQVINFGEEPVWVTTEFANYLLNNATRYDDWDNLFVTISGIWCWNDTVQMPQSPMRNNIDVKPMTYEEAPLSRIIINVDPSYGIGGSIDDASEVQIFYYVPAGWTDGNIAINPTGEIIGNYEESEIYKVLDFGTEPQLITKAFYNFIVSNAINITNADVLVKYNGKIIAPMTDDESTIMLKCMDKKMTDNVTVTPIPSARKQHLTLSKTSTDPYFPKGFTFKTKEYWMSDVKWDFCVGEAWGGYPFGFKKLPDFIIPKDLARLAIPEVKIRISTYDKERDAYEDYVFNGLEAVNEFGIISMQNAGATALLGIFTWVQDAEVFNQFYHTSYFEDNSFYINNVLYMKVGGERDGGIQADDLRLTLTIPSAEDVNCSFVKPLVYDYFADSSTAVSPLYIDHNGWYDVTIYNDVEVATPMTYIVADEDALSLLSAPNQSFAIVIGGGN